MLAKSDYSHGIPPHVEDALEREASEAEKGERRRVEDSAIAAAVEWIIRSESRSRSLVATAK